MDRKLLHLVMRKFLDTNKNAELNNKVFKQVNGINFEAQIKHAGCYISFINKYDEPPEIGVKFIEPQTRGVEVEHKINDYPNVKKFFLENKTKNMPTVRIPTKEWDELVAVHKSMDALKSFHGINFACKLVGIPAGENIILKFMTIDYDNIDFEYKLIVPQSGQVRITERIIFYYDPTLLLSILESISKFKSEIYEIHVPKDQRALFLTGSDSNYEYNFALAKRITKDPGGEG
jgi:hypothetical protein